MLVKLEDTLYSTAEQKAEFIKEEVGSCIEECLKVIKYSEELMLESLVHFCNTGTFTDKPHN